MPEIAFPSPTGTRPDAFGGPPPAPPSGLARAKVHLPFAVASVALVAVGAMAFTVAAFRISGRVPVLVAAAPIAAGQVITAEDVKTANVGADTALALIPQADANSAVGHTAAVPMAAGELLTTGMVGSASFPPAGEGLAAVSLKPGAFPPKLAAGDRVTVWPGPDGVTDPGATARTVPLAASAVVSAVGDPDSQGMTVVSFLADEASASKVEQAASVAVVLVAPMVVSGS